MGLLLHVRSGKLQGSGVSAATAVRNNPLPGNTENSLSEFSRNISSMDEGFPNFLKWWLGGDVFAMLFLLGLTHVGSRIRGSLVCTSWMFHRPLVHTRVLSCHVATTTGFMVTQQRLAPLERDVRILDQANFIHSFWLKMF